MARLLIKSGAQQAQAIELRPGRIRLGRSLENDFFLNDLTVSELHCEILVQPDFVVVRDLNSTNGTFIDGEPIQESELLPGQLLQMGQVEMVLDTMSATRALPSMSVETIITYHVLPDGYPACINHPSDHATKQCTRCNHLFCSTCAQTGRIRGKTVSLCPTCGSRCVMSAWSVDMKRKQTTFLGGILKRFQSRR